MIKHSILASLFICLSFLAEAKGGVKDTVAVNEYSNYDRNIDSLINNWYTQESIGEDSLFMEETDSSLLVTDKPDSFYIQRLKSIPSAIELTYNDIVKRFIQVYTVKKKDRLEVILGLKDYYFPIFEEILDSYNLPIEFKYLAVIESALNPRAVSRVGATGLWQFMYGTGRMYKLTINSFVDERRDVIASTRAAAKYFMDMYKIYHDWNLVIASYNCGPGNVNKAIRRSGGKTNYWDIYYYLPKETRGYVPLYIAATYAMNFYKDHGITPKYIDVPPVSDTIMVAQNIHLQQIADVLNLPVQLVRDLNPQYRRDIIPGAYTPSPLRLPVQYAVKFIDNEKTIAEYRRDEFFSGDFKTISPASYTSTSKYIPGPPSGNLQKSYYTVKAGDVLGSIATNYNVGVSDLRYWNNITRNVIHPGQRLVVYTPKPHNFKAKPKSENSEGQTDFVYYEVKNGDTLWKIASQYSGVSDKDIRKWNNLGPSTNIKPGQTLKIRKL
jgi:membrane-bound lytic murein transglycosylase D